MSDYVKYYLGEIANVNTSFAAAEGLIQINTVSDVPRVNVYDTDGNAVISNALLTNYDTTVLTEIEGGYLLNTSTLGVGTYTVSIGAYVESFSTDLVSQGVEYIINSGNIEVVSVP